MSSRVSVKKSSKKKLTLRERRLIRDSAGPVEPLRINKDGDALGIDTQPDIVQTPIPFGIKRRKAVDNLKQYSASQGSMLQKPPRDAGEDVDASDSGNSTETERMTPTQSSMGSSFPKVKEDSTGMAKDMSDETTDWQTRAAATKDSSRVL